MVTRSALPQNLRLNDGIVWEDFETTSQFILGGGAGTIQADTTHVKTGSKSLNLITTTNVRADKTISANMLPYIHHQDIWVYIQDTSAITSVQIYLAESGWTKYFYYSFSGSFFTNGPGWYNLRINKPDWTTSNGASWNDTFTTLRVAVYANAGTTANISFDSMRYGAKTIPLWVPVFDDGGATLYPAYQAMDALGFKGTFYTVPSGIDTLHYLTMSQVQEMSDAGHVIANHTWDHLDLTTLSEVAATKELTDVTAWQKSHGFTRGIGHMAFPYNTANATVIQACKDAGMLTGRTGRFTPGWEGGFVTPTNNKLQLTCCTANQFAGTTITDLATMKGWFDYACEYGGILITLVHGVNATPAKAGEITVSDWNALLNYAKAKKIGSACIDELYQKFTNPRYKFG